MKSKRNFNTIKVPGMTEVFPQAVIAGDFIFVSGTTGFDPTTQRLSDKFEEQARQAFINVQTILEEMGSSINQIVKTTVFMVAGNDFSMLNKLYAEVFPRHDPARSTPQVMPFPPGILISVECVALV